jgi:hypothetical protein
MSGYRAPWIVFWYYRVTSLVFHQWNPLCHCRFKKKPGSNPMPFE